MANSCPACGGRGQVQRDRPRGGLFGRFRAPEKLLERCTRCNGSGSIEPKAEVGRTRPGASAIPPTAPASPKAAASITLDTILSIPMDEEIQKQRAEYNALWDRATREQREYMPPPEPQPDASTSTEVEYISLSKDGTVLVTRRHYDGRLMLIDANTRLTKSTFKPDGHGWFQITPTGKELATVAKNKRSVVFYDIERWEPTRQTREVPAEISQFLISPDGSAVAIGYSGGLLACGLADGSPIAEKKVSGENLFLGWSRDSTMLAVACNNEGVVLSRANGDQMYAWPGPVKEKYTYPVMAVAFMADGVLVAGDNLGYLNRIGVRAQTIHKLAGAEATPVFTISAAPNAPVVAVGRGNGSLELWDISEGQQLGRASGHAASKGVSKYVECIEWFPDERRLCTWGGYDARIWSISIGQSFQGNCPKCGDRCRLEISPFSANVSIYRCVRGHFTAVQCAACKKNVMVWAGDLDYSVQAQCAGCKWSSTGIPKEWWHKNVQS